MIGPMNRQSLSQTTPPLPASADLGAQVVRLRDELIYSG